MSHVYVLYSKVYLYFKRFQAFMSKYVWYIVLHYSLHSYFHLFPLPPSIALHSVTIKTTISNIMEMEMPSMRERAPPRVDMALLNWKRKRELILKIVSKIDATFIGGVFYPIKLSLDCLRTSIHISIIDWRTFSWTWNLSIPFKIQR